MSRITDYFFFGCLAGWLTGVSQFLMLPAFVIATELPRKWTVMKYFTYHAELLPHTEQVVFHKVNLFGKQDRHIVDIRNLERVSADMVESDIIWWINMFDSQMVFRDSFSVEIFVFDSNGIWNQEALEHPLLY